MLGALLLLFVDWRYAVLIAVALAFTLKDRFFSCVTGLKPQLVGFVGNKI